MKTLFACIALLLITVLGNAQDNDVRTLFGSNENHSNGGYGAISIGYSKIGDKDAFLYGARGAWIIDHSLAIGLAAHGFSCDKKYDTSLSDEYKYAGGYGGLLIEPIIAAKSPIHVSFPIIIGAGGITYYTNWDDYDYWSDDHFEDSDGFFVFEPGVEVELNMVHFFRIGLGVSYRYTDDIKLRYDDDYANTATPTVIGSADMLRGINYKLTFKFGKF